MSSIESRKSHPAWGSGCFAGFVLLLTFNAGAEEPQTSSELEAVSGGESADEARANEVIAARVSQREPSSWRLHLTAAAARALRGYQSREMGFGAGVFGAVEWGPSPVWGIQLEGGWIGLSEGSEAPPPGVAEVDRPWGAQLGLGLRLRPFAPAEPIVSSGGLWISAAGGVSLTGGGVAPQFNAFLGYDFFVSERFGLGPALGYTHVFSTASGPRQDDASIGLLGLHATFDFAQTRVKSRARSDRDGDGIVDELDACPDEPEDRDGFEDEDGCPDPDNDRDGIPDVVDRCPNEPEDLDDFEDEDGCPDPDNDRDGVPDVVDRCPNEPEDLDDFEDEDGCPDLDNDGDKIPDVRDLCPNEPETLNGFSDNDGCPDEEHVRVVGDKIELDQKIHFWSDSSVIRAVSYPVLRKLAEFINAHPEYTHVDIEGHADERGPDGLNQRLSAARAESVKNFLIHKGGVERSRLSSAGFGSSRPLVEGKGEHAWFMNRRVEFIVTRERVVKEFRDKRTEDAAGEAESKGGEQP